MARAANRLRQQLRPEDPTDLAFDISEENIPAGFLKGDVRSRSKRHLLFATNQQLQQLVLAKNWYVDGTFKLCRQPFTQGAASKPNRFLYCLSSCLVRESGTTVQCCKKCWEYFLRLQQSEASLWTLNKLSGRSLESCCPTCHCRDVCFTGRKRCGER